MNKIILVEYESGIIQWYPYSVTALELIADNFFSIVDIQIIERGEQ